MLHLLRVEWLKLKSYRTFWVLLAMTILCIPGLSYFLFSVMKNQFPKTKGAVMLLGSPFAFPDVWQTISWNSTLLFILPGILIITLTTNEFTYKTHRQNIIDGWSRQQFIMVKLFELVLLSLLTTLVVFLTIMGFGFIANTVPKDHSIWEGSRFLFFYFVQMISYSMIAFLMAMLIKRAGLTIGAYLIYMLGENILVAILRNVYKFNGVDYMPEEVTDQLIPQPYLRKVLQKPEDALRWEHHIPIFLVIALVYLIAYVVITRRKFTTSDL